MTTDGSTVAWTRRDRRPGQPHEPQIYLKEEDAVTPLTTEGSNWAPQMSDDGRVMTWLAVDPGDPQTAVIYRFERA